MALDVGLTDFVKFAAANGLPKLQKVREIQKRGPYAPARDFWKRLRDPIIRHHREKVPGSSDLDAILTALTDSKKQSLYPQRVTAYKRFLRKKEAEWFEPPSVHMPMHPGMTLRIKPDLGLIIEGVPHVVKLYFSEDKLKKLETDLYLALMRKALIDLVPTGTQFAVLDVPRSKLIATPSASPSLWALIVAEALSFQSIWNSLN